MMMIFILVKNIKLLPIQQLKRKEEIINFGNCNQRYNIQIITDTKKNSSDLWSNASCWGNLLSFFASM